MQFFDEVPLIQAGPLQKGPEIFPSPVGEGQVPQIPADDFVQGLELIVFLKATTNVYFIPQTANG